MAEFFRITSRENPRLKFARRVRDGKDTDFVFVEGSRLVREAVRSGIEIEDVFLSESFSAREANVDLIKTLIRSSREVFDIPEKFAASLADTENSQGVFAIAKRPASDAVSFQSRIRAGVAPIVLYLSDVNNPSNLGAVARTAEAAGVAGVMTGRGSADAFSPKALRASMGSAFRLPIWEKAEFEEVLAWARQRQLTTTAADVRGNLSYTGLDWLKPRLLVFGSEARGLKHHELDRLDEVVYIPMAKGVESLNLAVSCGVILFEVVRQRSLT